MIVSVTSRRRKLRFFFGNVLPSLVREIFSASDVRGVSQTNEDLILLLFYKNTANVGKGTMMSSVLSTCSKTNILRNTMVRRLFATESYFERKRAAKQARVQTYQDRQQKIEERKKRRDASPRDVKKQAFKSWWDKRRIREEILERKARQAGKDWKVEVAVILERIPIVMADIPEWERDFDELQAYFGQFGKEYPKELIPERNAPTFISDEELLAQLPPNFRPAPRETEADHSGVVNTLDRKLKDRVFLLLEEDSDSWTFPKASISNDESLLQGAQRAVKEKLGDKIEIYCPSNAPSAVHLEPHNEDDQFFGTKTFYMRLQHDEGDVSKRTKHGWLDRQEIVERMEKEYGEEESKFYQYVL